MTWPTTRSSSPAYWVVDPDTLELSAWEVRSGSYVETGHVAGDQAYAATLPFPVEVVPAAGGVTAPVESRLRP